MYPNWETIEGVKRLRLYKAPSTPRGSQPIASERGEERRQTVEE